MESKINRITDTLRRDDGISGAMHYTEQISWILFLKFLNDLEETKNDDAQLDGEIYNYVLDERFRWNSWAVLKVDGKKDVINSILNLEHLLSNTTLKSNAGIIIKSKYTFKSSLYKKDEESKTVCEALIENQEKKE